MTVGTVREAQQRKPIERREIVYDEHGGPSEDQVMDWNEANDHQDDGNDQDEAAPAEPHEHHFPVTELAGGDVDFGDCECGTTFDEDQADQWQREQLEESRRA